MSEEDTQTHEPWCWRRHTGDCVDGPSDNPSSPEEAQFQADQLNDAYRKRNQLVAALVRVGGYSASIAPAPDAFGWSIVYVETPAGQVSWHVGPGDLDLFDDSAWVDAYPWDGHDTAEKYRRLTALEGHVCDYGPSRE